MDNLPDGHGARARWPRWAIETVTLVAPDDEYPARARRHADELADLLGPARAELEHVGSTAVPGLVAKPVLDLSVRLADPAIWCATHADTLARRAWHVVPPELDRRTRRLLVRVDAAAERRLAHLHLWWPGTPDHDDAVTFRDRLRADPALAAAYAKLKRASAAAHHDDREAYTASKDDFVARVLARPSAPERPATG